jgi:hypothetical protein
VGSFKPVLDALVHCGVIEDDSMKHIVASYGWQKMPTKQQGVHIFVKEATDANQEKEGSGKETL